MKGLLFSEPMVRAWMEGRKTVTRRLMKPQPDEHFAGGVPFYPGDYDKEIKPFYRPGETVYIKEMWGISASFPVSYHKDELFVKGGNHLWYKADHPKTDLAIIWKSPRFMPEWASRSHALIVSVRPERVQSITEEEAFKEGIFVNQHGVIHWRDDSGIGFDRGITAYFKLWDTLHPGSWGRNDWCWVYTLKKLYK